MVKTMVTYVINVGLALTGVLPLYPILWILEKKRFAKQLGNKWILEILDNIRKLYDKKMREIKL